MVGRVNQDALGDQADDFASRHAHSPGDGALARGIKGFVHRGHRDVGEVQGQLGDAIFLDVPSDALDALQQARLAHWVSLRIVHNGTGQTAFPLHAAVLPQVEGHRIGAAGGRGVQVDVVGHEEIPGADGRGPGGAGALIELGRAEVRSPDRIRKLVKPLVLALPAMGQVLTFG